MFPDATYISPFHKAQELQNMPSLVIGQAQRNIQQTSKAFPILKPYGRIYFYHVLCPYILPRVFSKEEIFVTPILHKPLEIIFTNHKQHTPWDRAAAS